MSISREEQKRNRKIWVDALRSGEYKQEQYTLRRHSRGLAPPYSYKYCCLGVACKVVPGMRDTPDDGGFVSLSVGLNHNCALGGQGFIECWGDNVEGQVSGAPDDGGYTAIAAGSHHTCALAADGQAICWGDDSAGQSSPP